MFYIYVLLFATFRLKDRKVKVHAESVDLN